MRARTSSLLLLLLAISCSDSGDPVIVPPPPPPPPPPAPPGLLIHGSDMSGGPQNLTVTRDGESVTTATVTVNGTAMTNAGFGSYQGTVTPFVTPGGQMTVVVTDGSQTATGVGLVPALPVFGNSASTTRGNPVTATWTTTLSPDSFFVGLNYTVGASGYITFARVAGSARQAVLQTADIPDGATGLSLTLFPFNTGVFSGDFQAGSNMRIRSLIGDRPFTFGVP